MPAKAPARKPKSTKRVHSSGVLVLLLPAEHERYKQLAEADGRSLNSWIRWNLRKISGFDASENS